MNRIEEIARAMAVADGRDPDETIGGGPNDFALTSADFNGFAVAVYRPAWMAYQRQANLFLAALTAVGDRQ